MLVNNVLMYHLIFSAKIWLFLKTTKYFDRKKAKKLVFLWYLENKGYLCNIYENRTIHFSNNVISTHGWHTGML